MLVFTSIIETDEDKSKFEDLYNEYRGLMYHTAYKWLRHEQDAEDAVHHVFVKIAENIKSIAPVSPKTKQLVVTMVENRAIDMFRVRSRHPEIHFNSEVIGDMLEQPSHDNLLSECILKLPAQQREVIWLKYHHGYDLREIAKMLGISLTWAQKIDQRAKKKLETLFVEGGGEL